MPTETSQAKPFNSIDVFWWAWIHFMMLMQCSKHSIHIHIDAFQCYFCACRICPNPSEFCRRIVDAIMRQLDLSEKGFSGIFRTKFKFSCINFQSNEEIEISDLIFLKMHLRWAPGRLKSFLCFPLLFSVFIILLCCSSSTSRVQESLFPRVDSSRDWSAAANEQWKETMRCDAMRCLCGEV